MGPRKGTDADPVGMLYYARYELPPRGWDDVAPSEYAALPSGLADALRHLIAEFDSAMCSAEDCPRPVGYHLAGDRDETTVWHWTGIIYDPATDRHSLLCEDHDMWHPADNAPED